jgi:hypothetical protein
VQLNIKLGDSEIPAHGPSDGIVFPEDPGRFSGGSGDWPVTAGNGCEDSSNVRGKQSHQRGKAHLGRWGRRSPRPRRVETRRCKTSWRMLTDSEEVEVSDSCKVFSPGVTFRQLSIVLAGSTESCCVLNPYS